MIRIMAKAISCPQCFQPVDIQLRACEHCGVDLALAALLAEYTLTVGSRENRDLSSLQLSPEVLVPKLGNYFIEKGILAEEELSNALAYQKKQDAIGQPRLIGQTLVDLELISHETLDLAVTEQILRLQSALQHANEQLETRVEMRTRELEHALTRLAELNQLKSNFIANVSHELRTPLTHIRGYLSLLDDEALGAITLQQAEALGVMKKSEARLSMLIEDLIQFSTFAPGGVDLGLEAVNLIDIFDGVTLVAMEKSNNKGIIWDTSIPPSLPLVEADAKKLQWALLHLIDNAIKFTPKGGRVQLGARIAGHNIDVFVADTGIGIDLEKIDEIFEPFHQLDGSSTRDYGGVGLGLAVVRKVIEAHNSDITIRSKVDEGSCVEFSLAIVDD
jgi:signal transduction histidine kinase